MSRCGHEYATAEVIAKIDGCQGVDEGYRLQAAKARITFNLRGDAIFIQWSELCRVGDLFYWLARFGKKAIPVCVNQPQRIFTVRGLKSCPTEGNS